MKKLVVFLLCFAFILTGCASELSKISRNITSYEIEAEFSNANKTLIAEQKVYYANKTEVVLSNLYFHLYPRAFVADAKNKPVSDFNFNKAYLKGFSEGNIDITGVKVGKKEVTYAFAGMDKDILVVPLIDSLYPDEVVEIVMNYVVTVPCVNFRFGYGENTINLGNFYPVVCKYENGAFNTASYHYNGDPFYSDVANYSVQITYPDCLVCVGTGTLKSCKEKDGNKIAKYSALAVRDFALCLSENFSKLSASVDETTVNYYFYDDENAESSLSCAVDTVTTFNNLIGKYPYEVLNVVQSNFLHGGMEYPNLILISDNLPSRSEYNNVIVHEIGHQWFYGIVGNNEVKEAWLDEGLTEYITAMFYELNPKYEIKISDIIANALKSYLLFEEVYSEVYGNVDTSMDRELSEFKTEPEYVYMVYVKGVLLFDNLRQVVGDSAFCQSIKLYYESNKFKVASKDNLIAAFEKHTTKDVNTLINSWVDGTFVLSNK